MEGFNGSGGLRMITISAVLVLVLAIAIIPVYGQISTPCTASMISSFTPCMNFITGSTANGSSPTAECCSSLKSLVSGSMDCACLIITGNVPFQLPINRTLSISLPRACKTSGVPLFQCKSTGSPLPAPGPVQLGPTLSPSSAPKGSSNPVSAIPAPAPETDTTLAPPLASPPVNTADSPTAVPGRRPVLTPSAAKPSHSSSPPLVLIVLVIMVLKYY